MVAQVLTQMLKFKNNLLHPINLEISNPLKITKTNIFRIKLSKAYLRIWKKKKKHSSIKYINKIIFTQRNKRSWMKLNRTVSLFI